MHTSQREQRRTDFWGLIPRKARLSFDLAVFFVFAPVQLLTVSSFAEYRTPMATLFWSVVSGLTAVGWASAFTRNLKLLFLVIPLQVAVAVALALQWPSNLSIGPARPSVGGWAILGCIVMGYILFVTFISTVGARAVRMQTELGLAQQIHAFLVPPIARCYQGVEVLGSSSASTEMGGDLIDVVATPSGLDLFLADVSGHGVRAGIVMAMLKAAVRTRLSAGGSLASLTDTVNQVIEELTEPDMFVTWTAVRLEPPVAHFTSAGHLPILHYRAADGSLVELEQHSLPLGVMKGEAFSADTISVEPEDLLVLYTDGLTEVMDSGGRQFGLEGVRGVIAAHVSRPLAEIHEALASATAVHGRQLDDQSVLLARVLRREIAVE